VDGGGTVRWRILPGPVGTHDVTVRIVSPDVNVRTPDVRVLLSP
jgi:hypothetical protein